MIDREDIWLSLYSKKKDMEAETIVKAMFIETFLS